MSRTTIPTVSCRALSWSVRGTLEIHAQVFRAERVEVSPSHGSGAREHVLVRDGSIVVAPIGDEESLNEGDYATFSADRPPQVACDRTGRLGVDGVYLPAACVHRRPQQVVDRPVTPPETPIASQLYNDNRNCMSD